MGPQVEIKRSSFYHIETTKHFSISSWLLARENHYTERGSHNIANAVDGHHYWHGCWSLWQNQYTEPALQVPWKSHCPQYCWHVLTQAWGGTAATGPVGVLAPLMWQARLYSLVLCAQPWHAAVWGVGTELKVIWLSGSGDRVLQSQDVFFLRPSNGGILWRESSRFLYVQASTVHIHFRSGTFMDEQKKAIAFPLKWDIP